MGASVLILTLNEEKNLPACLESVRWSDDIVVFDSFSTDRTMEVAKAANARVVQTRFDNERVHRAESLKVGFKHDWVYNPDADEITPPELAEEILSVTGDPRNPVVAYRVRRKDMFMGRWLKHSSLYPTWAVRLFRPAFISFERNINLKYVIGGPEGRLRNHYLHYSFNNGLDAWVEKHNRYSRLEAMELLSKARPGLCWRELASGSAVERRRALKELSFSFPCRGLLRFLYTYFLKLGFLDGWPGYHYCVLLSFYEHLISLKSQEAECRSKGLSF